MPSVTKNIHPLPDGRFRVRYFFPKEVNRIFDTRAEAVAFINEAREKITAFGAAGLKLSDTQFIRIMAALNALAPDDVARGIRILEELVQDYKIKPKENGTVITIAMAVEALFAKWKAEKAKPARARYYNNATAFIRTFGAEFGSYPVSDITPAMVETWVYKQSEGNRVTAKARISLLFTFCGTKLWIKKGDNPASGFQLPKTVKERVQVPDVKQIKRFMALTIGAKYKTLRAYLALRLFSGLRTDEAKQITWKHIDLHRRRISVPDWMAAKKTGARSIPISDNLVAWLELESKKEGQVAPSNVTSLELKFRSEFRDKECIALGTKEAKILDNVLRHSFGSYRYLQLMSLEQLSKEMGNRPRTVVSHYVGVVAEQDEKAFWEITPCSVGAKPLLGGD